jgi:hypothetical protein
MAHPYTDKQGRTWQLDALPAQNGYPGRPVIGYLCWVVATDHTTTGPAPASNAGTGPGVVGYQISFSSRLLPCSKVNLDARVSSPRRRCCGRGHVEERIRRELNTLRHGQPEQL